MISLIQTESHAVQADILQSRRQIALLNSNLTSKILQDRKPTGTYDVAIYLMRLHIPYLFEYKNKSRVNT